MKGSYTMEELKRITLMQSIIDKKRTGQEVAKALKISDRQVRRILKKYKENGPDGIKHGNKFHKPVHTFTDEFKKHIISLKLSENYINTNFSHFKDLLEEKEEIKISYTSLHNILKNGGIKSKKSHKDRKIHRRRKRKECEGMLVQTDGTPYDWFNIGEKYSIHGYIDDATSKILGLYMCENECLMGYLEITRQMLIKYGSPVAVYSDKHSVFFPTSSQKLTVEEELEGKEKPTTQFKRIMDYLGIEMIPASTSQAKGRIERLWNTLQDRLVTEFKINNITTIEQANKFLIKYIDKHNKKFAVEPLNKENKFVKLLPLIDLDLLLSSKLTRVIDNAGTFSINKKVFQIVNNDILPRVKVNIYISHKIGMIVEHNKRRYKVICTQNVPSKYSALNLDKLCKEHSVEVNKFAYELVSYDSKEYDPLLVTS